MDKELTPITDKRAATKSDEASTLSIDAIVSSFPSTKVWIPRLTEELTFAEGFDLFLLLVRDILSELRVIFARLFAGRASAGSNWGQQMSRAGEQES